MIAYKYLTKLSPRQKMWFIASVVAVLLISVLGILCEPDRLSQTGNQFTISMSIQEIAPKLDVTGKGLARELSHHSTGLKYYLFAAIVLFGLVYLTRFGRPNNANISEC